MAIKRKETNTLLTCLFFEIKRTPARILTIKNTGIILVLNISEGTKSVPNRINKRLIRKIVNRCGYKLVKRFIFILILQYSLNLLTKPQLNILLGLESYPIA